ncbi:hypothetical protein NPIL_107421 [Nephila pilipes]|uniref:Uncharacterized protein n=1 Tax=Nephila pilipes TaxID=299642 RepID=A0A8X6TQS8_NEPPI|nr:hypothetical protein NPIL_107421 [Nephila pilipes]
MDCTLEKRFATELVRFITSVLSDGPKERTALPLSIQQFVKNCLIIFFETLVETHSSYFETDHITREEHRIVSECFIVHAVNCDNSDRSVLSCLSSCIVLAFIGAMCLMKGAEEASHYSIVYIVRYLKTSKLLGHIDGHFFRDVYIFCEQVSKSEQSLKLYTPLTKYVEQLSTEDQCISNFCGCFISCKSMNENKWI